MCSRVSEPGDQPVRLVVEKRVFQPGPGWEIAREQVVCSPCAARAPEARMIVVERRRPRVEARPIGFSEEDFER